MLKMLPGRLQLLGQGHRLTVDVKSADLESPDLRCAGDRGLFFSFTGIRGLVSRKRVLVLNQASDL